MDEVTAPTWWQVATDAVIPASAILISAGIAVFLARGERVASRKAGAEDRAAAFALREAERADAAAERERARVERLLEETIELYAVFVSGDPHTTDFAPVVRQLRARVMILQTVPTSHVLGEWLATDMQAGLQLYDRIMRTLPPTRARVDEIVAAIAPVSKWAHEAINVIATWLSGEITDDGLRRHMQRGVP